MPFTADLSVISGVAKIVLSGELDASNAPIFQKQVESAAAENPKRLALVMSDLEYMASAGLRGLIFAKQKMGRNVELYVVGAQPQVMSVIKATGLDRSVIIMDSYDAATIENL
jgi:anti-anti-sigma factor